MTKALEKKDLKKTVRDTVRKCPVYDIHTHIYDTNFGDLLLWGIDELLVYHYLVAEVMRYSDIPVEEFWKLSKKKQAELIWEELFVAHSPISESTRGVLTCLERLGVSVKDRDLDKVRAWFKKQKVGDYIDKVFELGNVEAVVMTNNPFDGAERPVWEKKIKRDARFKAALRIDDLLVNWPSACVDLKNWGYKVTENLNRNVYPEIKRFLNDWIDRIDPIYFAASLPPTFAFPDDSPCGRIMEQCVLPVSRERDIPFAMMIGVKKLINKPLGLAGDGVGKSDITAVEKLCADFPDNKFLVTMLARENQHELAIAARKFRNLMVFGCWWFLNNPSLIREITTMRVELLGTSFIPQHSDARVLDQLIYKWTHSREIIAEVLIDKYEKSIEAGWPVTKKDIRRDVENLFGGVFRRFVGEK